MVIALGTLGLTGCVQSEPSDASPQGSAAPSATTSESTNDTAVAANLLQLCDHAQDAFRSGGLGDAAQGRALAAELQGMMDVAAPDAAEVLRPMAEAADAMGADGQSRATPELQRRQDRAYRALRRACVSAGSQVWG